MLAVVYVVLGMHKSGTTLVAEVLHHSGIPMIEVEPEDIQAGYDDGNKYERRTAQDINKTILAAHEVQSLKIRIPEALDPTHAEQERMRTLARRLDGRHDDWGFKDPRTTLTYPLWRDCLPRHRIVAIFRPLYQLTERYKADRWPLIARRMVRAWHAYNERILRYARAAGEDALVLSYTRLMEEDEEWARLERFVGRPLRDRRKPRLMRGSDARGPWVRLAEAEHRLRGGPATAAVLGELETATRAPAAPAGT